MSPGNGYLTENMLIAFPFEDGKFLAWSDGDASALQLALQKCFVDASIYISDHVINGDWPAIGMFYVADNMLCFKISACGHEVQLAVSAQTDRFPIVSGKAPWGYYTVVLSSEGIKDFLALSPPALTSSSAGRDGVYLPLCAKCVTVKPLCLDSIMVYDGIHPMEDGPHFVLKGDVSVKPLYNVIISEPEEDSDGNSQKGMQISAVPGAGIGCIPCVCTESVSGNSILAGTDGHARIFNDTCYDFEPGEIGTRVFNGKVVRSQKLIISAKCTACCTCQMYESIVNDKLVSIANAVRMAKSELDIYHAKYEQGVKQFNKRMNEASLSDVRLSISGMPIGEKLSPKIRNTRVKGKMSRCAFTAIICNSSFFTVNASLNSLTGTDSIVEVVASWSDIVGNPLSTVGNSVTSVLGKYTIYPGRSLVVNFISVKNDMSGSVSTGGYSGTISVGLSYIANDGSTRSLGSLQKTVSV